MNIWMWQEQFNFLLVHQRPTQNLAYPQYKSTQTLIRKRKNMCNRSFKKQLLGFAISYTKNFGNENKTKAKLRGIKWGNLSQLLE